MERIESVPLAEANPSPSIVTNGNDSVEKVTSTALVETKADGDEALNEDGSPAHSSSVPSPTNALPCEMCHNYETNLTKLQACSTLIPLYFTEMFSDSERNLKEQLAAAQHLADRYQTELSGERLYRYACLWSNLNRPLNELESKMNSLCADAEKEAKLAMKGNERSAEALVHLDERCEKLKQEQRRKIYLLKDQLRQMNEEMTNLSQRYLKLLGANRKCATEMQAQAIELPADVDQLQFLCLQLREELIETRAAKEHNEAVLRDEITMLQVQRREDEIEKHRLEHALTEQVNGVSEELGLARSELSTLHDASHKMEEMDKRIIEYQAVIEELEKQVKSMQKERADLEMTLAAYKQKCTALQQELDTSEAVQKDFVKLSQNLQIELEKIRQAEQEVRWQFNDDVHVCNQCHSNFTKNSAKVHCQHCGKIFCAQCLTWKVPAGPHGRLAKVCKVCHTLLIRDSAPFFSHSDKDPL
uniref:FYVE-type domain-containing protein n=1 Tax=Ascaris lumbricoides TaxID=6252 RepID=A0A0M3HP45_ASCLU